MNKYRKSVVIENKTFMMWYEKGKFRIDPLYDGVDEHGNKYPTLSKHLGVKMDYLDSFKYCEHDSFYDLLGLAFADMFDNTSYSNENISDKINNLMINSQRVEIKKGKIYLISDGQFVKIGGTKNNLHKRVNELQTGNPRKLIILGSYNTSYLLQTERLVQHEYKDLNILNEWFNLSEREIKEILDTKLQFKDTNVVKTLGHSSYMNILQAQFDLIEDAICYKIKTYKRKFNTTSTRTISTKIIDKIKNLKNNKASIEYIDKFNIDSQITSFDVLKRKLKELESLNEYSKYIQKSRMDYMEKHDIYYDDDAFVYKFNKTNKEVE